MLDARTQVIDTRPYETPTEATRRHRRRLHRDPATYTGPRTPRGKRRSALNRVKRGLCPDWVLLDLEARNEDPAQFRCLHRDLIGWFNPTDASSRMLVAELAEAWWEKRRLIQNSRGADRPEPNCLEIDRRIDDLLYRLVWALRACHRKWRYRLESDLGKGLYDPIQLRLRIEARVPLLGGKPPAVQPRPHHPDPLRDLEEELAGVTELLSLMYNRPRE